MFVANGSDLYHMFSALFINTCHIKNENKWKKRCKLNGIFIIVVAETRENNIRCSAYAIYCEVS